MKTIPSLAIFAVLAAASTSLAQEATPHPQDFRHRNLSNKDFAGGELEGASFLRVRLSKANFEGADLSNATFRQCLLEGANFRGATFGPETKFRESSLNDADFAGVDLKGADFTKVNLRGANLANTKGWGDLKDCSLAEADLRGADFSAVKGDLESVQWSGAVYNDKTVFPKGFGAEGAGMVKK
ncbi:MAG: pentapeptide repeat-containing protein [Terrimicrobiaceae bacterium]|nr:pentapeptide repeat-containing protein [Terrimicrobiaceae bacterium]